MNVRGSATSQIVHVLYDGQTIGPRYAHTVCGKMFWIDKQGLSPAPNGELTKADTNCMACIAASAEP